MMQYMILIYSPAEAQNTTPEEWEKSIPVWEAYGEMLRERDAFVSAAPLAPPGSATTLRLQDGKKLVIDGPFAETKEWLGGYYLVNAVTLDEALDYAAQCPGLERGAAIEVRPLVEFP